MRVLDLFSGIGGFSLGLERAGMRTVAFCEIDPYCRAVLAKRWPGVPIHGDIRAITAEAISDAAGGRARRRGPRSETKPLCDSQIDVICGGFPCQDISVAGKGAGLAGARSGLWREYHRLIRELRPRYVIVENVSALLSRGLEQVLGDLASIGYDAEWHCIPASHVGAPHRRDRIWIIAYPSGDELRDESWRRRRHSWPGAPEPRDDGAQGAVAYPHSEGKLQPRGPLIEVWRWLGDSGEVGDTDSQGFPPSGQESPRENWGQAGRMPAAADWWATEPDVGRMAHGVPRRVDRLRALGNAIVPQIAEIIGRAIMRAST